MRCRKFLTELKLVSPLPAMSRLWLAVALVVSTLYALRVMVQPVPPEDHLALALVICFLLTQAWFTFEKTSVEISLPDNRCRLRYHRLGRCNERSLPVSQIHSARLEFDSESAMHKQANARIALVTPMGMIPVSDQYQPNPLRLQQTCQQINLFLENQTLFFQA